MIVRFRMRINVHTRKQLANTFSLLQKAKYFALDARNSGKELNDTKQRFLEEYNVPKYCRQDVVARLCVVFSKYATRLDYTGKLPIISGVLINNYSLVLVYGDMIFCENLKAHFLAFGRNWTDNWIEMTDDEFYFCIQTERPIDEEDFYDESI